MRQIKFISVCIENFRSFTESTVIPLSDTPGLKFVAGLNQAEPALGANGAGKSTVFDAITYALYGYSVRGLRARELIAHGERGTRVMVIVLVDGKLHSITRSARPERITLDDKPAEQPEIDELVGLSYKRFLHSVVFGQGVPLFIDLSKPERARLLDEVLNLEIWLDRAEQATKEYTRKSAEHHNLEVTLGRLQGELQGLPDIAELTTAEANWESERAARVKEAVAEQDRVHKAVEHLQAQVRLVEKRDASRDRTAHNDAVRLEKEFAAATKDRGQIIADIKFYEDHDDCPECGQPIAEDFCTARLSQLRNEEANLKDAEKRLAKEARAAWEADAAAEQQYQKAMQDIAAAERQQAVLAEQIRSLQQQAIRATNDTRRIKQEANPYTEQRERAIAARRRVAEQLGGVQLQEQAVAREIAILGLWRGQAGFRKVRMMQLGDVLSQLAVETRNSLLSLGLAGWQVEFTNASETQSGNTRLEIDVRVTPPQYPAGSFDILSGGEGQRARLAASLGLASLIQRWAGVQWTLEVWDEPTAWLSEQGVEQLLDCLAARAEARSKAIYLADHRALNHSGFSELYQVTKDLHGSHWQRV
jgi:DNA repair exonuclease SbcCD ATPase subunit